MRPHCSPHEYHLPDASQDFIECAVCGRRKSLANAALERPAIVASMERRLGRDRAIIFDAMLRRAVAAWRERNQQ